LDILAELQSTLNPHKGGEMAQKLKKLYLYCSSRLLRANRTMDTKPLDETVCILTGLRDAFAEANAQVEGKPVAVSSRQASGRMIQTDGGADRSLLTPSAGAAGYAQVGGVSSGPAGGAAGADAPVERSAPLSSQAVVLEAAAQMREAAAATMPHPVTPVRRAMAAYSSCNVTG